MCVCVCVVCSKMASGMKTGVGEAGRGGGERRKGEKRKSGLSDKTKRKRHRTK